MIATVWAWLSGKLGAVLAALAALVGVWAMGRRDGQQAARAAAAERVADAAQDRARVDVALQAQPDAQIDAALRPPGRRDE